MLPRLDGFRVLRSIRDAGLRLPILILTAKGDESDKVRGLKMGADDYVTNPSPCFELLARVEAALRRGAPAPERRTGSFGDAIVDFASRTVTKRGEAVSLSRKEFDLLAALLEKENAVRPPTRPDARRLRLRRFGNHAHDRHAHRRAPAKTRRQPEDAGAHIDGAHDRVPIEERVRPITLTPHTVILSRRSA